MGRKQHPQTEIVVAVTWDVVVAVGGARVDLIVVPGAATHHPPTGAGEPRRSKPAAGVWQSIGGGASVDPFGFQEELRRRQAERCRAANTDRLKPRPPTSPCEASAGGRGFSRSVTGFAVLLIIHALQGRVKGEQEERQISASIQGCRESKAQWYSVIREDGGRKQHTKTNIAVAVAGDAVATAGSARVD